jgi:phosphopantothenoylcysteine decarboxylase/phosphopantothenate--cysteine ligase
VTLVSGPTELASLPGVETVRVVTAEEMLVACRHAFVDARVVVAAAAVADFRPAHPAVGKAKKADMALELELARTPDILAELAAEKGDRFLVGFAAETETVMRGAERKLQRKKLDLIVANDIRVGFGGETTRVTILDRQGQVEELPELSKREVAHQILDRVVAVRRGD